MVQYAPGKPDLTTPAGRDAYRRELHGVARPVRLAGLGLALAGVVVGATRYVMVPWPMPLLFAALGLCVVGFILMTIGIVQRTRYHYRRFSGH